MSLTPRKVAVLLGAAALGVTGVTGTGWAAGSAAQASGATPSFAPLSPSQVKALSSGKQERMVVVFDDQLTNLPANRAHRQAREATAASMQAPLVAQLKQVGATHITTLSLLNAVAATMPAAEAQALSHTPGVKEVVPDGTIIIGDGASNTKTVAASRVRKSTIPAVGGRRAAIVQRVSRPIRCSSPRPSPASTTHPTTRTTQTKRPAIATGAGRHRRERRRQLAGREPEHDPARRAARGHRCPEPERERLQRRVQRRQVSTIGAQGTVTYTYASQLPYSNFPSNCTFRIVGDATGASSSQHRLLLRHQLVWVRSWLPSRRSSPGCSRR